MNESPKYVTAASKLMSNLTGDTRPVSTLSRQTARLSRESLIREMKGYYNNCVELIQTCAQIAGALRRTEIQNSLSFENIKQYASVLTTDLKTFSERIRAIKADQDASLSVVDDGEFHMQTLRMGEAYMQWTTEFNNVVIPTYETLITMVNEALVEPANTQSEESESV